MVDNVGSFVTDDDLSSESLVQIHVDALPFVPDSLDGHLLQQIAGVTDCNSNGVPDLYEISQGIASDADGNGLPDDCDADKHQIDWVLLGLGVLIIAVTLWRHLRKRRTRFT
jgi:hypothetical protein